MADVELEILEKSKVLNTEKPNALNMIDVESHIKR